MITIRVINSLVPSALISDQDVEIEIQTTSANLLNVLETLKLHSLTQMKNLLEITIVDLPLHELRFYVSYFLLSTQYNARVRVSVQTSELAPIMSVTSLFSSAN